MKNFAVLLIAAALAGCATAPRPQVNVIHHKDQPRLVAKPAPPAEQPAASPNQAVKKRWFGGYKVRLFHR
jgi:hypothetical protein